MEKSGSEPHFYRVLETGYDGTEQVSSTPWTAGPWNAAAQHGGPPAALLGRAVERLAASTGGGVVARLTMELLGPVPVGPLAVSAATVRPGRSVRLLGAELVDPEQGRAVASVRAWVLPESVEGPGVVGPPPAHGPETGAPRERAAGWLGGYLDAIEWRWVRGSLHEPGDGVVWMRPPVLVAGEETSPLQRVLACVDSASGVSAALDLREWAFLNTELTVHVLRPLEGAWVCLEAETTLGPGAVGLATSTVWDPSGPVARSAQTLLLRRR